MRRLTRLKREIHFDARTWGVGVKIYLKHVNFWYKFWMTQNPGTVHYSCFLTRLALWLDDCWGVGWDIRSRWESEYFIRIGYLEIQLDFRQKD